METGGDVFSWSRWRERGRSSAGQSPTGEVLGGDAHLSLMKEVERYENGVGKCRRA